MDGSVASADAMSVHPPRRVEVILQEMEQGGKRYQSWYTMEGNLIWTTHPSANVKTVDRRSEAQGQAPEGGP